MNSSVVRFAAALLYAVPVWACGGASTPAQSGACGLPCSGSVTCDDGNSGTASIENGACVLQAAAGSVTLSCNDTAVETNPTGTTNGTWSFDGTHLRVAAGGNTMSCTFGGATRDAGSATPEAGGLGGPCKADADCSAGLQCSTTDGHVGWCTKTCSMDSDCGAGSNLVCAGASSGTSYCFPFCGSQADCAPYPGSNCVSANNGWIEVCSY